MGLVVTENGAYDAVNSNPGTGGTTLTVLSASGALWPDPAVVGYYNASVWPSGVAYDNSVGERVIVSGKSGAVLTIVRAQAGSTAKNIVVGWQIAKGWGAEDGRGALATPDRNLLINGGLNVCQPINAGGATLATGGAHGPDGWYVLSQTGNVTYNRITGPQAGMASPFYGYLGNAAGSAQRMMALQVIPSWRTIPLRGENVRLDTKMFGALGFTGRFAILEWTGTADSVTKTIVNSWTSSTYSPGNFFTSTTKNVIAIGSVAVAAGGAVSLASIRGTVGASANNLIVCVWTEGAIANGDILCWSDNWLVMDTVSEPYVPRSAVAELHECQAYYQKSYDQGTLPGAATFSGLPGSFGAATTDFVSVNVMLQVTMRAAPTISFWDSAGNASKITESTAGAGVTTNVTPSTGVARITDRGFEMVHDPAGSILGVRFGYAADARL